jgi:hypothetical protein
VYKLYIHHSEYSERPEDPNSRDYWFRSDAVGARYWPTENAARDAGALFDQTRPTIKSPDGRPYVCSDFKIEERAPNEFVIFYEVPFLPVVIDVVENKTRSGWPRVSA